jgi:hypothetical protein
MNQHKMPQTFHQKKLMSEELFRNALGQGGSETTPNSVTTEITAFSAQLGGIAEFVPVVDDQYGLFGWCSDGVEEKIRHDGGRLRFGWAIWEWPEVMLTAEFHAVWEDETESRFDITPKPQKEMSILFVADESYPQNFNFDQRPTNRRFRIFHEPDHSAAIGYKIESMKQSQLLYETKRAKKRGLTLAQLLEEKIPSDPLAIMIDRLISVCDRLDIKTDTLSDGQNAFHPDREYIALSQEKIRLLSAVQDAVSKRNR